MTEVRSVRRNHGNHSAAPHRFRGWAARHPLTTFSLVLFSIDYPLMALLILASHGVIPGGSLPAKLHIAPDELAGALLTFTALLPATPFATWATDGREGLHRLLHRMVRWGWSAATTCSSPP